MNVTICTFKYNYLCGERLKIWSVTTAIHPLIVIKSN